MTRLTKGIALALLGLLSSGCAPLHVNALAEPGANLSSFHTYGWAQGVEPTGDPRLDNNSMFHERLRNDIDKGLAGRGLENAGSSEPDLLVHYHVSFTQKLDLNGVEHQYGTDHQYTECASADCAPYLFDAGMVILDLVDAHTKQVVWRGWADASFDRMIDDQASLDRRVDAVVGQILEKYPRAR